MTPAQITLIILGLTVCVEALPDVICLFLCLPLSCHSGANTRFWREIVVKPSGSKIH